MYGTATGMVHHLETSSCPGAYNMSRDEVYRFVRSKDPRRIITIVPSGWSGEPTYEVSDKAWDGSCYRCYLCSGGFGALSSLRAHINSNTRT